MERRDALCPVHPWPNGHLLAKGAFAVAGGLLTLAQARTAAAEGISSELPSTHSPAPMPPPAASERFSDQGPIMVRRWYGYQTVVTDVLSTSLFAGGLATFKLCLSTWGQTDGSCNNDASERLLLTGLAGYALGGPVIHAAHGHWDKAGYSLALRVAPVAAAMGVAAGGGGGAAAPLLFLGGAGAAMIIDSAALGYETITVDTLKVNVASSFDPKSRTGSLVVAGSF